MRERPSSSLGEGTNTLEDRLMMRVWRNGRRASLKMRCRRAWGFESLHPHHKLIAGMAERYTLRS